jgi:hypothetical protein
MAKTTTKKISETEAAGTAAAPSAKAAETPAAGATPPDGKAGGDQRMRAVLVVRARHGARRRAGIDFGKEAVELNAAWLTEEQIAAIEADPELVATREERPELPAA